MSSFCEERGFLDYLNLSNSNSYNMPERKSADEDAFETPRSCIKTYKKVIKRTAKAYHIEPELLASVVFVETYGGGITGWYELKNHLSVTKQILFGNATIGITQVTPEKIKDLSTVINYNYDVFWQLNQGAIQLSSIRDALYPNTKKLNDEKINMVLRFYNQGTKVNFINYDLVENPVGHYALAHYKKNLRIRKRIRLNKGEPYYSNEISVHNVENKSIDIYVFNMLVAQYRIGGSRYSADKYVKIAYENRFRIKNWLE